MGGIGLLSMPIAIRPTIDISCGSKLIPMNC
jgi:hypothetical protein